MASVIPELKIGAKLGNGHFGEVFLGEDSVHGTVAVKILARKPEHSDDQWQAFKVGFLAEAQKLSKARHRNVVPVYHINEHVDGNSIHFCMALCPGGSLQKVFEAGPMPLLELRKVATEVSLGLDALHARQMLHRDIKPGNILLDVYGVAQLGDFGLVTDNLIMGYGSQAGYSDHIAYEVWQGGGTSVRTDIWALGMTLYRLLHGQIWYEQAIAARLTVPDGNFVETLRWLPHIPKAWRRVIRKMLNDAPELRFQTAGQVLNALSTLPTPGWTIAVTADLVRWQQASGKRLRVVEWVRHSARQHEWKAWTEPLGSTGRTMTLAGSGGVVGSAQALKELVAFFEI